MANFLLEKRCLFLCHLKKARFWVCWVRRSYLVHFFLLAGSSSIWTTLLSTMANRDCRFTEINFQNLVPPKRRPRTSEGSGLNTPANRPLLPLEQGPLGPTFHNTKCIKAEKYHKKSTGRDNNKCHDGTIGHEGICIRKNRWRKGQESTSPTCLAGYGRDRKVRNTLSQSHHRSGDKAAAPITPRGFTWAWRPRY